VRDEIEQFRTKGVQPLGMNPATVESHEKYAAKFKFNIISATPATPGSSPVVTFSVTDPTNGDQPYDIKAHPAFTAGAASTLTVKLGWTKSGIADIGNDGNGLNFGGPYLGFFATLEKYLRQMPGRLVGETVDKNNKRGYVLTMATREQHIRREKATSNICTNEGLCALAAAIYLTALGKNGLMELARLNLSKSHYLKGQLKNIKGIKPAFTAATFNEFVIEIEKEPDAVLKALLKKGVIAGLPLKRFYPELSKHILLCATEMNTKEQMDELVEGLGKITE